MPEDNQPKTESSPSMPQLLGLIARLRFISAIAVISSLASALLMLLIGAKNTLDAFIIYFGAEAESTQVDPAEEAALQLLESLDNFLVGLVFLYFAFGIYSLFIDFRRQESIDVPNWLQVSSITALKKILLEVLIVLLAVVFVKGVLESVSPGNVRWEILAIPLSILAIAASNRLISFEKEEEE